MRNNYVSPEMPIWFNIWQRNDYNYNRQWNNCVSREMPNFQKPPELPLYCFVISGKSQNHFQMGIQLHLMQYFSNEANCICQDQLNVFPTSALWFQVKVIIFFANLSSSPSLHHPCPWLGCIVYKHLCLPLEYCKLPSSNTLAILSSTTLYYRKLL